MITNDMLDMVKCFVNELHPLQIYLFGSYARGDFRKDSDYDFYIIMPKENKDMRIIDLTRRAYSSLSKRRYTRPTDIVVNFEDDFSRDIHDRSFERRVYKEGVVLYDRNNSG